MSDCEGLALPDGFDWPQWVDRWDRMQERYLVRRRERFEMMVRLIRDTQQSVRQLVDLGCGTGTLTLRLLEVFPQAQVFGLDGDPTMLALARSRLESYGTRARIIQADLRDGGWRDSITGEIDGAVSATALHWLDPGRLPDLYRAVAGLLRPGGIFLNADHVGSSSPAVQKAWEQHREEARREEGDTNADDWREFWSAYAVALGLGLAEIRQRFDGMLEQSVEAGLPLAWHFDQLRAAGFSSVDCFWRCDCDAIYGGIR